MNVEAVMSKAGEAADLLKSMANDRRLVVLCELVKGERTVGELETVVGLSQSAFTGFCPAAIIFKRLGLKEGCAFS